MESRIYSVSEITRQIKLLLEDSFPAIWVEGEISNYKPHHSGHIYFTLKDTNAQISCVMWRSRASGLPLDITDGLKVRVYGTLRLYEKSGRYQLDLIRIETSGLGELQQQFELLKQRLNEEGLFDQSRKKELPQFPQVVGVITSPTGAALQDILSIHRRRSPATRVIIRGVKVQGAGAAEELARAVELFNRRYPVDVLIIGRGGGSLEDLWPFNEERLARAISASEIPIVSAVGHEIDFTISDFVSDLRAPTPSAAAEIVFAAEEDLRNWLGDINNKQKSIISDRMRRMRLDLLNIKQSYAFRRPKDILQNHILHLEDMTQRLFISGKNNVLNYSRLIDSFRKSLDALNPYNVLNRGYAMVFKNDDLISSIKKVEIEDNIAVKLRDGRLTSIIKSKKYE